MGQVAELRNRPSQLVPIKTEVQQLGQGAEVRNRAGQLVIVQMQVL